MPNVQGHAQCVSLLFSARAEVDLALDNGSTPLLVACHNDCIDCVRLLLDNNAAVDQAMENGATPAMVACQRGHGKCMQLLSSHGANRLVPILGELRSAEQIAAEMNHLDLHAWLVMSRDWCSPLHHVEALSEKRSVKLLRAGADLHCRSGVGAPSPLELAYLQPAESATARQIIRAAEPWSHKTHTLFPAEARLRAVNVLRLGYMLAIERDQCQLIDVWRQVVLPLVVER